MKKCSKCKKLKEESEFYPNKRAKDKLEWYCKLCIKKRRKTYQRKNRKFLRRYSQARREDFKKEIEKFIGNRCKICGSTKKICYHQKYGKRHSSNFKYILKHYWNFIPLCSNCHLAIHNLAKSGDIDIKKLIHFIELLKRRLKINNL